MELRVKKWREKDLKERQVKWMFKGWDPLMTGWGPLWDRYMSPVGDCADAGCLGILHCVQLSFPFLFPGGNQNNSSFD